MNSLAYVYASSHLLLLVLLLVVIFGLLPGPRAQYGYWSGGLGLILLVVLLIIIL